MTARYCSAQTSTGPAADRAKVTTKQSAPAGWKVRPRKTQPPDHCYYCPGRVRYVPVRTRFLPGRGHRRPYCTSTVPVDCGKSLSHSLPFVAGPTSRSGTQPATDRTSWPGSQTRWNVNDCQTQTGSLQIAPHISQSMDGLTTDGRRIHPGHMTAARRLWHSHPLRYSGLFMLDATWAMDKAAMRDGWMDGRMDGWMDPPRHRCLSVV